MGAGWGLAKTWSYLISFFSKNNDEGAAEGGGLKISKEWIVFYERPLFNYMNSNRKLADFSIIDSGWISKNYYGDQMGPRRKFQYVITNQRRRCKIQTGSKKWTTRRNAVFVYNFCKLFAKVANFCFVEESYLAFSWLGGQNFNKTRKKYHLHRRATLLPVM